MTNPYAPPQAVVQDIADPGIGFVLAERGTRLGAAILDTVIFAVMVYVPIFIAAFATGAMQAVTAEQSSELPSTSGLEIVMLAVAVIGLIVWLGITIKFMHANGQSIGKKACGIKVVRRDGSRASLSRLIWLRNVVNALLGLIPLYGIIDSLVIFGEARRCLHDHIADTIVINA